MNAQTMRAIVAAVVVLSIVGCSGSHGTLPATVKSPTKPGSAKAQLTIHWAKQPTGQHSYRKPQFLSPSAQSVRIDAAPNGSSNPTQTMTTVVNNSGGGVSTVSFDAPVGADIFTFSVYDRLNAAGTKIGGGSLSQTISQGAANVVKATLEGYIASLAIVPSDGRLRQVGSQSAIGQVPQTVYAVVGPAPVTFSVSPLDSDGNVILSSGAPAIAATSDPPFLVTPVSGANNTFTVQLTAGSVPGSAPKMVFTAPGPDGTLFSASYGLISIGLLYATAGAGAHVYAYTEDGASISLSGGFPGLQNPVGIAYDAKNLRVYIADAGVSKILAYDPAGNPVTNWTAPSVPGITGVAFSPGTNHILAVSTSGAGAVLLFDTTGTPVSTSGFSPLHGQPVGIADAANDASVAVVESPNYIDVFDQSGNAKSAYSGALIDPGIGGAFNATSISAGVTQYTGDPEFLVTGSDSGVSGSDQLATYVTRSGGNTLFTDSLGLGFSYLISAPISSALNPVNGDVWVATSSAGLSGVAILSNGGPEYYAPITTPGLSNQILPPTGVNNFTSVTFAHL